MSEFSPLQPNTNPNNPERQKLFPLHCVKVKVFYNDTAEGDKELNPPTIENRIDRDFQGANRIWPVIFEVISKEKINFNENTINIGKDPSGQRIFLPTSLTQNSGNGFLSVYYLGCQLINQSSGTQPAAHWESPVPSLGHSIVVTNKAIIKNPQNIREASMLLAHELGHFLFFDPNTGTSVDPDQPNPNDKSHYLDPEPNPVDNLMNIITRTPNITGIQSLFAHFSPQANKCNI